MSAMNKKTAIATIAIFALLSLFIGIELVEVAEANFVPFAELTIISPTNQTYNSNFLTLTFTASFLVETTNRTVTYSIDGQPQITITGLQYNRNVSWETTNGTIPLPYLSNGSHLIEMSGKISTTNLTVSTLVHFTINSTTLSPTASPTPSLSPSASPSLSPSPTLGPTQTATPTDFDKQTLDLTPILILSGIAVVAVAVGLVYLKRRK